MLALVVLLERRVDLGVNVVAAPLEFLAAAARTGGVGVDGHWRAASPGAGVGTGPSGVRIRTAGGAENGRACLTQAESDLDFRQSERTGCSPVPPRAAGPPYLQRRFAAPKVSAQPRPGTAPPVLEPIKDGTLMVTADLGACEWFVYELRRSNLIYRGQLDQLL